MRHRSGLHIQLTGLGQRGVAEVEVFGLEEGAGLLADGAGEDRRIQAHEVPLAEELPDPEDHLVADPHDVPRAGGSQPEVTVVEEEIDPVLLGTDGIVLRDLHGLDFR